MALFDNNNNKRTSISELSEEETRSLAMSYASSDWHNVKGTLDIIGKEYNEDEMQQALFDYKLGLIQAKQERKFGKHIK